MKEPTFEIPAVTVEQMTEIDRLMMEDYHIGLVQMMENAGLQLACFARKRFLNGHPKDKTVTILAGSGSNGGGAMVCARHLSNWGAHVIFSSTKALGDYQGILAHQSHILSTLPVTVLQPEQWHETVSADLIIDGLIGYSLKGDPTGLTAERIEWINHSPDHVLSLDCPSGLDMDTGFPASPCVYADATLTLGLPKTGLMMDEVKEFVGELYLADISIPGDLLQKLTPPITLPPIFNEDSVLRLY